MNATRCQSLFQILNGKGENRHVLCHSRRDRHRHNLPLLPQASLGLPSPGVCPLHAAPRNYTTVIPPTRGARSMGQVPPLRALKGEARQMSCRYRQPLKCKYPGPAMLCLQMPTLGCHGKGGGGVALCMPWLRKRQNPVQGKGSTNKGRDAASPHSPSPLPFTPSDESSGRSLAGRALLSPPCPSHCSFPTPQSPAVLDKWLLA